MVRGSVYTYTHRHFRVDEDHTEERTHTMTSPRRQGRIQHLGLGEGKSKAQE